MKTSMEEAFQLWWYMSWRTALVVIPLNIIAGILMKVVIPNTSVSGGIGISTGEMILYKVLEYGAMLVGLLASVYFLSLGITKLYKKSLQK